MDALTKGNLMLLSTQTNLDFCDVLLECQCFVLTVLVNLYEEPEKPANALEYPFEVVVI